MLAAGNFPQHRTICEFRRRHLDDFKQLFVEVVGLARELGLARFGKLSVDGTKVRANASKRKAMSYGRMQEEERRLSGEIGVGNAPWPPGAGHVGCMGADQPVGRPVGRSRAGLGAVSAKFAVHSLATALSGLPTLHLNTEDFCHGLLSCAKSYSTVLNVDPPEPQSKRRWIGIRKVTTTPRSAMMEDEYRVEVERLDVEDAVCGLCRSPVNPGAIVCAKCGAHKEERFGFRGGLARSRLLTSLVAGAVSLPLMFISRSESRVFLVFLVFFLMCLISAWRAAAKIKKIPARTYWVKRS